MLDYMKTVLEVFLERVISPGVARTGDVDEVVTFLKQAIVKHVVERHPAPKDILARHFDKSDRWLYRQLENAEQRKREPKTPRKGHQLLYDVMTFYAAHLPKRATPTACAKYLRQHKWKITTAVLQPLLDLYAGMGYLQRFEGKPGEEPEYKAVEPTYTVKAEGEEERLQVLERNAAAILPIAVSYLRGDDVARFSMSEGEVMERHLKAAVRDIAHYQVKRLNQAVEDSIMEDPDEQEPKVKYRMLLLCGLGPFFDEPEGGIR